MFPNIKINQIPTIKLDDEICRGTITLIFLKGGRTPLTTPPPPVHAPGQTNMLGHTGT